MSKSLDVDVEKFVKTAKQWKAEIAGLREILLSTPLEESYKWSKPCYTFEGSNVAIIQPFKGCLALMFFKGSLLKDSKGLLIDNGPNSQASKRFEFVSAKDISSLKTTIKSYIKEAIELEKSGQKVEFKKEVDELPEELVAMFKKKPAFKKAFLALTPGRQRAYVLHFAGAKQSTTRLSRIERHMPRILEGLGMND